jgi:lipopolysaccharide/colanic/teichoic acid biosynthesis glycosyltransferase
LFPDSGDDESGQRIDWKIYPDLARAQIAGSIAATVKRLFDIAISSLALLLLSPLILLISAAVKLSSKGPVLFRQERVGLHGIPFTFLKFRSMFDDNDSRMHEIYVAKFIAGRADFADAGNGQPVYKIMDDPRVTPLGRWLRRTSLDELPQFYNVLEGHMSLVGPRPALPYEVEQYRPWHRRRILQAKPGLTGLWQISGRSRTTFDEMVRLDLRYLREASLALDLKILLKTPLAVLTGNGAH